MRRTEKIEQFLEKNELLDTKRKKITSDASNREYLRLFKGKNTSILMNSNPKTNESIKDFIYFTNFLRSQNLSAPEIYDADIKNGLLLLEDLGGTNFADTLKSNPKIETDVYTEAINQLVKMQSNQVPKLAKPYTIKILLQESLLFTEWYLRANKSTQITEQLITLLTPLLQKIEKNHSTLVLRDYHAENLIWMPNRKKIRRIGLLDYQDALIGHPAYDLASLLKDARRDVSLDLRDKMINYYLEKTKYNKNSFLRDYSILSAQRNLKIIGIFTRLCIRDQKKHYLKLIPRVWKNLQNDLLHPDLTNVSEFIKLNAPAPTKNVLKTLSFL